MSPILRVGPSFMVKDFWKHPYRHLKRYVSMVILNQGKLTMKADHYNGSGSII